MPRRKKTKIVATLGPATSDKATLLKMMEAGADVFRINFSHADYNSVKKRIKMIRELNEEHGFNAAILADLQGPKLRVGVMKGEVIVNEGDEIIFATGESFEGTKDELIEKLSELYKLGKYYTKVLKDGEEFQLNYKKENIPPVYFVRLMHYEDPVDGSAKNKHTDSFFLSYKAAEEYVKVHWFSLHEHWVNTVCIEKVQNGFPVCLPKDVERVWLYTDDMLNKLPYKIEEPKEWKRILNIDF